MTDHKDKILEALEKLRKLEVANKELWKARAYATAIKELKALDKPITSADDVKGIKGIGAKIYDKIKEIIETGKLERLKEYNAINSNAKITEDLMRIHGIGPAKAKELIEKHNIKSVEDLAEKQELLNATQKMGYKYYKDIEQRIKRPEMIKHDGFLIDSITEMDPKLIVQIVGSYRRNAKDSGDIDILITHKDDPEKHDDIIRTIVTHLQKKKYLVGDLALGDKKYMGICRMKHYRIHRRIDMLYTDASEFPYAQLYFTGSQAFNIALRNVALSKNLSLSEHGLKDAKGKFIKGLKTETEILNYLGFNYIEPEERSGTVLPQYAIIK